MANFKNNNKGTLRTIIVMVCVLALSLVFLAKLTSMTHEVRDIPFSTFLEQVEKGAVKKVRVSDNLVTGVLANGQHFETTIVKYDKLWDLLKDNKVEIEVKEPSNWGGMVMPLSTLLLLLLGFFWAWSWFRSSRSGGGGHGPGGIFSIGKSKAKMFMPSTIKENFDSVAGADDAKEDLKDIVDYLRDPKKYTRLGARVSKGVLLIGEPGNGKTLLARAVAGEANCPFYSISGSDFIEVFVGVGAARVRDLFAQARKTAPCIIFIDEIDAVGRHRGNGYGGGHDEREQTLNQLLTELDGFEAAENPIIVIAATNRPDVLDKALLRPGRFDRRVNVPYPDLKSREKILSIHAKNIKLDPQVDLYKIARGTPGFSGADLANLVNEAAVCASKYARKKTVTMDDFEEAADRIMLGRESKTKIQTREDLRITAYHEAGHALMTLLQPDACDPLHKLTIVPRGRALGVTHSLPEREKYTSTKKEKLGEIVMALGGRVAEELVFDIISTGAYSDFRQATQIAHDMVCAYGMSDELGMVVYMNDGYSRSYSEQTGEKIDIAVKNIIQQCYNKCKQLMSENRDKLDKLAEALIEKETMYADEVYELLGIEPRADFRLVDARKPVKQPEEEIDGQEGGDASEAATVEEAPAEE